MPDEAVKEHTFLGNKRKVEFSIFPVQFQDQNETINCVNVLGCSNNFFTFSFLLEVVKMFIWKQKLKI